MTLEAAFSDFIYKAKNKKKPNKPPYTPHPPQKEHWNTQRGLKWMNTETAADWISVATLLLKENTETTRIT